ncbi:hypothetical protein JOQ06_022895, partial [Pogonophryne albipinna]
LYVFRKTIISSHVFPVLSVVIGLSSSSSPWLLVHTALRRDSLLLGGRKRGARVLQEAGSVEQAERKRLKWQRLEELFNNSE